MFAALCGRCPRNIQSLIGRARSGDHDLGSTLVGNLVGSSPSWGELTWCTLFANSRCVIVQGLWWWPWNAAICLPSTGVLASPAGHKTHMHTGAQGNQQADQHYKESTPAAHMQER